MSKLYNQYLELKKDNPSTHYLFHSGIFYLFLDEDAKELAPLLSLKLLPFTQDVSKCGFPEKGLTKYEAILKDNNIPYQIIERSITLDNKPKEVNKNVSQTGFIPYKSYGCLSNTSWIKGEI